MLIFLQFSIGTRAVVTSSRHLPFCFHNFVFLLNCLFVLYNAHRISVCVISVNKSHEFLLKVRRLSSFFFDDDAYAFTSTRRNFFPRRRKGFDFDDESTFFPRRRTLLQHSLCRLSRRGWNRSCSAAVFRPNLLFPKTDATLFSA